MSNIKLFRLSAGQATELQGRAPDQKKTSANSDREIKVMTMKVSKGLGFPVVTLPGVNHMSRPGEDEKDEVRVFYVATTRATQRLVIGLGGDGFLGMLMKLSASQ